LRGIRKSEFGRISLGRFLGGYHLLLLLGNADGSRFPFLIKILDIAENVRGEEGMNRNGVD